MTFIRDVAEGVHVITRAHTNMFLVEDAGRLLVVDAGLPAFWPEIGAALDELGASPSDVEGVLLTHAHFDHVGCARRMRTEWRVPVWVHAADRFLALHPYSYRHERSRFGYPLTHPGGLPLLLRMAADGALTVHGVDSAPLPLPDGILREAALVETPGHTDGHVAIHLPSRDVVFSGDALVTLDPYNGRTGPQIVAGAATADSGQALASLSALRETGATSVLPGHGGPWRRGVDSAVDEAVRRGVD